MPAIHIPSDAAAESQRGCAGTLETIISAGIPREAQISMLSFEVSYGRIESWQIELSTVPGQVGCSAAHEQGLTLGKIQMTLRERKPLCIGAFCPEGGWSLHNL